MIDRTHTLSVNRQAALLNISRGTLYYQPKPPCVTTLAFMNAIDALHLEFPFMGSRQLTRELARQGHRVGRLRVRTLMIAMGIKALSPQPGTSQRNPAHTVFRSGSGKLNSGDKCNNGLLTMPFRLSRRPL